MPKISSFESYGQQFYFEPPVEVGPFAVDSLGKLAALAAAGPNAHHSLIDTLAMQVDSALQHMHMHTGTDGFEDFLNSASSIRGNSYTVTSE